MALYFTQLRNSDAEKILKSKEHLEGVYKSLQRQYQAKNLTNKKQTKTISGTISEFSTGSFQTLSFIKQAKEDDLMKVERERDEYRFDLNICTIYALYMHFAATFGILI